MIDLKQIKKYAVNNKIRIDKLDDLYRDIFKSMDDLMLDNIKRILKSTKGVKAQKAVIEQIYKAEEWDNVQNKMNTYRSSKLKDMRKIYKKEIDDLKRIYPLSDFKIDDIATNFRDIERMAVNASGNLLNNVIGTKGNARAILDAVQVNLFVDSKVRIYEYLNRSIKSAANRNVVTELATAQNNVYNKLRVDFFKGIETKKIKRYIYAGVRDSKNRDVCANYVGKIKTEEQWKSISNHQNGSMWDNRGGWNCRHYFLYVSDIWTPIELDEMTKSFETAI